MVQWRFYNFEDNTIMLIVVSPAKTLDYETPAKTRVYTIPDYLDDSQELIHRLRRMSSLDIAEMMKVSKKIADLNFDRYEAWKKKFTEKNARQAVLAFKGDVYTGLDAESFTAKDFKFAQNHFRVLSGLYGLLRPLDLMQPYRLEMGTKLDTDRGNNLYEFWGSTITEGLNKQLKKIKSDVLINLASNEYFKAVKSDLLNTKVITPVFKEFKDGNYRFVTLYAKKARGFMCDYIIRNHLEDLEDVKSFNTQGYRFNEYISSDDEWVFSREDANTG